MAGAQASARGPWRVLLLTDVVDSTALAERLGADANGALWADHDRVSRGLLADHGGYELERTDGIGGVFGSVDAAVAFARAYHAATRALPHPLVVRAAVHAGDLTARENPAEHVARGAKRLEVDGLGVAVAARVLSVCGGGGTLLTAAANAELGAARATSQGHWRLKGVSEPVELFAVGDGATPEDAGKAWRVVQREGQWVPARQVPHSLPAERDAFVGRAEDLRALADRLDGGARLVSVLGIGGTGKTRLVTRFAWITLGEDPGGAWFCDLSEARSAAGIAHAVAVGLGVQLGADDPLERLGAAIAGRGRCLVVLDNFEQVTRHAAETVGRWCEAAPQARFVVTTREVLGLSGETALALAPLVPDEAASLFVTRAAQAKRDFALTEDDRAHVAALTRLLDGLPLAIELAASRSRVMSPKVLLQRMGERFKLLSSTGARHTRQATLRGALDWSWDLLSADEQQALAQLSVFEGGFDLEAAEAVLSLSEAWPVDAVAALVDKSLVRPQGRDRFDLLVSVQEYAAEKLDALGGRAGAEARHGARYAAYGDDAAVEALDGADGPALRRRYGADFDNLVAACRRALGRGDGEVAVGTYLAAWGVLNLRGPMRLALELGDEVLAAPIPPARRASVMHGPADAAARLGRAAEARSRFDDVLMECASGRPGPFASRRLASFALGQLAAHLDMHEGGGDQGVARATAGLEEARRDLPGVPRDLLQEGRAQYYLGLVLYPLGRIDEARVAFDEGLALLRAAGNLRLQGHLLHNRGGFAFHSGRPADARADFVAALALARDFENRESESVVYSSLGVVLRLLGRTDEAVASWEEAITASRAIGSRRHEASAALNLADARINQGRFDEAAALLGETLATCRTIGDRRGQGVALLGFARVSTERRRYDEALAGFEAARAVFRDLRHPRFDAVCVANVGEVRGLQGRWEEARVAMEEALASFRAISDRDCEVQVLNNLADIHLGLARTGDAKACAEAATTLAVELGSPDEHARSLALRARAMARDGDVVGARATLAEAERLWASAGTNPVLDRALDAARAEVVSG